MTAPRILIADDDRFLAAALAIRCRGLGLQVQTAHDARTALNMLFESPPEIACLDVNMPCGNGLSVCEMVSGDSRFAGTALIVLTGNADPQTILRCHSLCAYYVPKCVDLWSRIGPLLIELLHLPVDTSLEAVSKPRGEGDSPHFSPKATQNGDSPRRF